MGITIVGLGPGAWGQVTLEAQAALNDAAEVVLRTARHPTVAHLPSHLTVQSFDSLYDQAQDFATVYQTIVDRVWELGQRPQGVLYAVPGHPLVAEATVRSLIARAKADGIPYKVLPGLSFIEPALVSVGVDPLEQGLQLVDALDPRLEPDRPALIAQVYDRRVASDLKVGLLEVYPPSHPVTVVQGAGTPEERTETVELAALDHRTDFDHLTCLYLPSLTQEENLATFTGLRQIVARLRAPGGCPWDREQTHVSLKPYMLEESYEVLQALDDEDMPKLAEELGDLILNVLMQIIIAQETGEFTFADVFRSQSEKLIRRHPHVFGEMKANTAADVLANWEIIKNTEREQGESALSGIPHAMPALAYGRTMLSRAGRLGLTLDMVEAPGLAQAFRLLLAQTPAAERLPLLGKLLLWMVDASRELDLDPEEALRVENIKFRRRFGAVERAAQEQDRQVADLPIETIQTVWRTQED